MNTRTDGPAIFLLGPTAAGKSDLACQLHERLPVELISVDSGQVYRGMDIGTAKPDAATRSRHPHALLDVCEPDDPYSAARFCSDAIPLIRQAWQRNRIPLLVGGTFLYFRALNEGMHALPSANAEQRQQLQQQWHTLGPAGMHQRLAAVDPEAAQRLNPSDQQRILRALEVHAISGIPLSQHWRTPKQPPLALSPLKLALIPDDRAQMREHIGQRFYQMMEHGLLEEAATLWQRHGHNRDLPAMRSVGYRQLFAYLRDEHSLDDAVQHGIIASRRYAKRQLTWLRRESGLHVLPAQHPRLLDHALRHCKRSQLAHPKG